jgi:hypothetical protein
MIGDLAAGGTPSNLGKIGETGKILLLYFKVEFSFLFQKKSFG